MSKLTVGVTQKHIDEGKPGDCNRCMFALALAEHFPRSYVSVGAGKAYVYLNSDNQTSGPVLRFSYGSDVDDALVAFDNREPVEPGGYVFTLLPS